MLVVGITLSTKQSHCVTAGWNSINFVAQQQRSGQLKAAAGGKTK